LSFGIVYKAYTNLCIIFVIAGNFDEIKQEAVDSVYFATESKRTERNKKFVMSESTKVTKPRKHDHSWASAVLFPGGEATSTFCLSFSNC